MALGNSPPPAAAAEDVMWFRTGDDEEWRRLDPSAVIAIGFQAAVVLAAYFQAGRTDPEFAFVYLGMSFLMAVGLVVTLLAVVRGRLEVRKAPVRMGIAPSALVVEFRERTERIDRTAIDSFKGRVKRWRPVAFVLRMADGSQRQFIALNADALFLMRQQMDRAWFAPDMMRAQAANMAAVAAAAPTPPPASASSASPASVATPEGPLFLPLPRGAPGQLLEAPAPWAQRRYHYALPPAVDSELGEAGLSTLQPGWWTSPKASTKFDKSDWRPFALILGMIYGIVLAVMLYEALVGNRFSTRTALFLVGMMTAITVPMLLLFGVRDKKRKRTAFEREARSFLRIDTAGAPLAAVAAHLDMALRAVSPEVIRKPPPAGAAAAWEHVSGGLSLVLWAGLPGELPLLQLDAEGSPERTAGVKGTVEIALYIPHAPPPVLGAFP